MKKIMLCFDKETEFDAKDIIEYLKENFTIIDDDDKYSEIHYITINTDSDVMVEIGQTGVTLRKYSKPHVAVHIYNHLLWKVHVWL